MGGGVGGGGAGGSVGGSGAFVAVGSAFAGADSVGCGGGGLVFWKSCCNFCSLSSASRSFALCSASTGRDVMGTNPAYTDLPLSPKS